MTKHPERERKKKKTNIISIVITCNIVAFRMIAFINGNRNCAHKHVKNPETELIWPVMPWQRVNYGYIEFDWCKLQSHRDILFTTSVCCVCARFAFAIAQHNIFVQRAQAHHTSPTHTHTTEPAVAAFENVPQISIKWSKNGLPLCTRLCLNAPN